MCDQQTNAARTTIQHQISNGLNDLNVPDEVGVSRREPSYDVWNNLEDPDFWYQPCKEDVCSALMRKLLEELFSWVECAKARKSLTTATAPWTLYDDESKNDQELDDAKKGQELDDAKKDQELDDAKKDQELDDAKKDQELDDAKKDQELDDAKKDQELDDAKKDQELDDAKTHQACLVLKENGCRKCQHTELPLTGEAWLPLVASLSSWYEPYFEDAFSAEFRKLMDAWLSWVDRVKVTAPWTYVSDRFEKDLVPQMLNVLGTGEMAGNNEETDTGGEGLETVHDEDENYNQQSLKTKQPCCYVVMETLKKPSLEKSEKAFTQKAIIAKFLLDVVSDTNPSECHIPSDSNSNVVLKVVVNKAELNAPVETWQDQLSDEESQNSDATLDEMDCTKEELTDLSGDIATSAMQEYLESPTVEALADDESESVHTEHSGCNTEKTASAPVPAEGVQPMLMHNSDEESQKTTSSNLTKDSGDTENLWDKELSLEEVSDMRLPQAATQQVKLATLETAQEGLLQTDQVVSALTLDQATDVRKTVQVTAPQKAQAIVHPQAAPVLISQALALQTALMCPQLSQPVALQMPQVLTVQPVTMCAPSQCDVLALVTTAQKNMCRVEAAQGSAPPAVNVRYTLETTQGTAAPANHVVCTLQTAQGTAPTAVHAECTLEAALGSAPQTAQVCPFEVDQGTTFQTGQASAVASVCKEDGVDQLPKVGMHSYAEAYTSGTTLRVSADLHQSAPPLFVIDDVVLPQNGDGRLEHSSANESSSEGVHVAQQGEAGNDGAPGDSSVAPDPSTAISGEMFVNSLSSLASIFAGTMVGLPTGTLYTGKVEDEHKNVPVDEDSDERKKKAMDQLRKEREKRVKQTTAAVKKICDTCSGSFKANKGGDSDVRTPTHQTSHVEGLVLLSNVQHIFQEGAYVPLPSQEAMAKTIGKGGNGVVAFIYHGGREFAVKETGLRQEELETWSSVNHRNVIELCAVVEGDWDSACPKTRRCYQMMPRMTGDLKSLLEKERPTLCHYFCDFKGDSDGMKLVLGNAKYILLGVLNGLKHLHSRGIMHRDIKLQNILVDCHCQCRDIFLCPRDGDRGYGVLISDFDSVLRVERGREKLVRTKLRGRPIKYSVHGTPGYRPPETSFPMSCNEVLPEWISLKTDMWSFGTMVVKLFVGSRGPHSQKEMATLLLSDCLQSPTTAQRPKGVKTSPLRRALAVRPDEVKKLKKVALLEKYFPQAGDLHQLVQSCLAVNSEERPTVGKVMEEPFFGAFKGSESMSTSADERGRGVGDLQTTSVRVGPSYEGESRSPISRYNCTQKPMVQDT